MMKYFDASSTSDLSATASKAGTPPPLSNANSFSFSGYHDTDADDTGEVEYHDIDIGSGCWAYEGVVLPGGMVMLGRWWSPMDEHEARTCTGPFVFWNVEDRVEGPDFSEVAE